ncbi:MAG: IS21 family transposase [Firmicutes bacterium]|nr:IS21 family transposase [Bacillota bacterium]
MVRWKMYSEILRLKNLGFNKSQVARQLGINVKTVSKYWDVDAEGFSNVLQSVGDRSKKLDKYNDVILGWLREFPDISSAQVMDWLKEHYKVTDCRGRTVRRYVSRLRKKHNIHKKQASRQYQAVVDPPMGKQMQIDFGETTVRKSTGGYIKIYGMGVVLSHSRYKYAEWSDKPLTSATFIQMLGRCFDYIGGVPEELVFDQDKIIAVSENHGDIIYTFEFEKFKQAMGFKAWLCRKSDPESKGRVEAVVKYMKRNFAANRLFIDLKIWNRSCEDWLERTANTKRHGTTKKIPAEVFLLEKQHLKPVPYTNNIPKDIVTRAVRKDNTILYKSNRYSVPVGTYKQGIELELEIEDNCIILYHLFTNQIVAKHKISLEKGALIQNNNHLRDNSKKIDELYQTTLENLGGGGNAAEFLKAIRREKTRYVRDQFGVMNEVAKVYPKPIVKKSIAYCLEMSLYSAVDCRCAAEYFLSQQETSVDMSILDNPNSWPQYLKVKAEQRSITAYSRLLGGAKH